MKKLATSLMMLTTLSGCASIVVGSTQTVDVNTVPPVKVTCDAKNERGDYSGNGQPGSMLVKRSQSRLEVNCQNDEYTGTISQRAHMEPWFLGNLIIGGLVGLIVDPSTGAMFAYDDHILVPLKSKEPLAANPMPDAVSAPAAGQSSLNPSPAAAPQGSSSYDDLMKSGAIVEAPKR